MDPSTCATCHHMTLSHKKWGHSRHTKEFKLECTSCHHGPQIESRPQNCANCHDRKTDMGPILSLKNAVHTRTLDRVFSRRTTCPHARPATPPRRHATCRCRADSPRSALVPCSTCHETEPSRLVSRSHVGLPRSVHLLPRKAGRPRGQLCAMPYEIETGNSHENSFFRMIRDPRFRLVYNEQRTVRRRPRPQEDSPQPRRLHHGCGRQEEDVRVPRHAAGRTSLAGKRRSARPHLRRDYGNQRPQRLCWTP